MGKLLIDKKQKKERKHSLPVLSAEEVPRGQKGERCRVFLKETQAVSEGLLISIVHRKSDSAWLASTVLFC